MKLFKKTLDFKLFGVRVFLMLSTYRYGYKRGEKREEKPYGNQMNLFTENDTEFLASPIIKEKDYGLQINGK
jgi:hypothetical protein